MAMTRSTRWATVACALAAAMAVSGAAEAALLVDRGLPTDNLNVNTSSRSNVAWADSGQTAANPTPNDYSVYGDTFTNTSSSVWSINSIRLWTVGSFNSLSLLGEPTSASPSALATISTSYLATPTTYANGMSYVGSNGVSAITQIDFAVDLTLNPGEQFVYFLNGTGGAYVVPYMSASNAALSGSPQEQADGLVWVAELTTTGAPVIDSQSFADYFGGTPSDFNVQVSGTAATVPEPASIALLAVGLIGAGFLRRRKG